MILHIALILAFAFQLAAAAIAIRLTRETKYNAAWFLLSFGLILAAALRFWDIISRVVYEDRFSETYVWLGVLSSFCFAVGVFYVRKALNYLKNLEEERRQLEQKFLTTIINTEEQERLHFAKEMHDGIGPLLSTVKLSLSSLLLMEKNQQQKEIIKNTDNIINEAIKSIKEISNNLTPHILTNFGLEKALNNFIHKINQNDLLQISFSSNITDQRFNSSLEVALYRVICELISNTIKHALACHIVIDIRMSYNEIRAIYTDDGIGFDPKTVLENDEGMGFSNMISRIDSLKGKIDVQSAQGEGIVVTISIPVKK